MLSITVDDDVTPTLVRLEGALRGEDAQQLSQKLEPLLAKAGAGVLVDLADVARVDSQGLAALVGVTARANTVGSHLVFVRPSLFVDEVIRVTRLDRFLPLAPDLEAGRKLLEDTPEP